MYYLEDWAFNNWAQSEKHHFLNGSRTVITVVNIPCLTASWFQKSGLDKPQTYPFIPSTNSTFQVSLCAIDFKQQPDRNPRRILGPLNWAHFSTIWPQFVRICFCFIFSYVYWHESQNAKLNYWRKWICAHRMQMVIC